MNMDRERIIILAVVFASSHCAAYAHTKIIKYVQQAIYIFKLLYTSSCTGTEISIILLKKFSLYLIVLMKDLFSYLELQKFLLTELNDAAIYLCNIVENITSVFWDGVIFLNCEVHESLCYIFGVWLPNLVSESVTHLYDIIKIWSYSSGLGSFAVVFLIFIFCLLLYFTFLITLVIIRLYKLFLKPLIKMLTTLLNYRRRFVLRSRRL